jgi:hypothetical protein
MMRFFFSNFDGVKRLRLSRYGSSDISSSDRFWRFSHDYHEEGYIYKICPDYYVHDNGDFYSRLPSGINQAVRLLFADILRLVLLGMLIDYFNIFLRACKP